MFPEQKLYKMLKKYVFVDGKGVVQGWVSLGSARFQVTQIQPQSPYNTWFSIEFASYVCVLIFRIPSHVLLPEDEAWDGQTQVPFTSITMALLSILGSLHEP